MPTCDVSGLTASLLVSDLSSTLSDELMLTMGQELQLEADRVNKVLTQGRQLLEQHICEGLREGEPELIGSDDDFRIYMVVAKDTISTTDPVEERSDLALSLNIRTTETTLRYGPDKRLAPDSIKTEIFLNGDLVDTNFWDTRKLRGIHTRQPTNDAIHIHSGKRVHRQIEKPWIYRSSASLPTTSAYSEWRERWLAVSTTLCKHAAERDGIADDPTPSTRYLKALADLPYPEGLVDGFVGPAILDVVFTVGHGRKDGPETVYSKAPKLFRSMRSSSDARAYRSARSTPSTAAPTPEPQTPAHTRILSTGTIKQDSANSIQPALIDQYGLHMIKPFANVDADSSFSGSHSELHNPLAHMAGKMGPTAAVSHAAGPSIEFLDQIEALRRLRITSPEAGHRMRYRSFRPASQINVSLLEDPFKRSSTTDAPFRRHTGNRSSSDSALTQQNIDLAVDPAEQSDLSLLHRLIATTPKTEMQKMISSILGRFLAGAPVKSQPRAQGVETGESGSAMAQTCPKTPKRKRKSNVEIDEDEMTATPTKKHSSMIRVRHAVRKESDVVDDESPSKPGSNRSAKRWDPDEATPEEAVENFKIPDLCKDSVISYAEGDAKRQITKQRHGYFEEKSLVVGMRFIVI